MLAIKFNQKIDNALRFYVSIIIILFKIRYYNITVIHWKKNGGITLFLIWVYQNQFVDEKILSAKIIRDDSEDI